jgi:hypothetical protein
VESFTTETTNLATDYLAMLIEDGVVDNLLNRGAHLVTVRSPLPLRIRMRIASCIFGSNGESRSFCKLYKIPSSSFPYAMVKVFLVNSCVLILFIR